MSCPCCQASGSNIFRSALSVAVTHFCQCAILQAFTHVVPAQPFQWMSSSIHEAVPRGMLYFHSMLIGLLDAQVLLLDLLPGAMILWFFIIFLQGSNHDTRCPSVPVACQCAETAIWNRLQACWLSKNQVEWCFQGWAFAGSGGHWAHFIGCAQTWNPVLDFHLWFLTKIVLGPKGAASTVHPIWYGFLSQNPCRALQSC